MDSKTEKNLETLDLTKLCGLVSALKEPYDDLAELIENRAYAGCEHGDFVKVVGVLKDLASVFEVLENKSEENSRNLADVYILIGEICQYCDSFIESIAWFKKAAIVDDHYALPFHHAAVSYSKIGDSANAIKYFEQEIALMPGNYYSYLLLANLYEKREEFDNVEDALKRLLQRDPENIQALHLLVMLYHRIYPEADCILLQKRLTTVNKKLSEMELIIWVFHQCALGNVQSALDYLVAKEADSPELAIANLLKAHLFTLDKNYARRRRELAFFKSKNQGKTEIIRNKLAEFNSVFGDRATKTLEKLLVLS
ncbi:MAG: tetratricopeptide repeat protein [Chitinivibrionales bacterium]|nr:tetratricopeptide repeat protein [Chitinivibrionales bacterium]